MDQITISGLELSHSTPGIISLLSCLSKSKFNQWETQNSGYLKNMKFAFHLQLEHNERLFSILFGLHYDLSDRPFYPGRAVVELTNVKLEQFDREKGKILKRLLTNSK